VSRPTSWPGSSRPCGSSTQRRTLTSVTHCGLVYPGRCRLRAGWRSRRGHPGHGGADVDAGLHRCRPCRSGADRAQLATVLQVVWRSIGQFLDAILLAAWWLGIGWLLRQDHLRLSRLSLVLAAAAAGGAAQRRGAKSHARCAARRALRALDRVVDFAPGGILRAKQQQLPPLPRRDPGSASRGVS
jgi:hypothetical protein